MNSKPLEAMSRRQQQGAESRTCILEAAHKLMSERGFAGTSISAVSRRSGLPASSIYWHFESKEGLLASVVEDGVERFLGGLPPLPAEGLAPEERARAALDGIATHLEANPEFLRLFMLIALERGRRDETSFEPIQRARRLALDTLRRVIETALDSAELDLAPEDTEELARFALAAADGGFVAHHIDQDSIGLRRHFELIGIAIRTLASEIAHRARRARREEP